MLMLCVSSGNAASGIEPGERRLRRNLEKWGALRKHSQSSLTKKRKNTMYYVYILTNQSNSVLYIGVTNDLRRRLQEHRNEVVDGFTKKYHVHKLVYFEEYSAIFDALEREKRLKGWKREKKNLLVESRNPDWNDFGLGIL